MLVCDGCSGLWAPGLHHCGRCGDNAVLRPFGSHPDDQDHPMATRMQLSGHACGSCGSVWSTRMFRCGRCGARMDGAAEDAGPEAPSGAVPGVRDSVRAWRDWAVTQGVDPEAVESMTKTELRDLAGRAAVGV